MREAGELARETSRRPFKRWTKGDDDSPVTEGDIAVNDLLRARLGDLLPAAAWVSEETAGAPDRTPPLAWVVDPIDGTRAYIAGRADWSISVALVEDARPRACRALRAGGRGDVPRDAGRRRHAQQRTHRRERRRRAWPAPNWPGPSAISTSSPRSTRASCRSRGCRRWRCGWRASRKATLDAAFSSPGSHDWDLAAADLLVHEAGGLFTDISGATLSYNAPQAEHGALLAAGSARHASLIDAVRDRRGEFA